jgi:hypothetical protein
LVGLFCFAPCLPAAIVLGVRSLRRISRSEGTLGGKSNAVAGLVLAGIGVVLWSTLALGLALESVEPAVPNDRVHAYVFCSSLILVWLFSALVGALVKPARRG